MPTKVGALALCFMAGIGGNFRLYPRTDYGWPAHARKIDTWRSNVRAGRPTNAVQVPLDPPPFKIILPGTVVALEYGFESGALAPWTPSGGTTAVVTAGATRTGSFGLELSSSGGVANVFQDIGGLTPGQNYEVTAFVRSPPGSGTASLGLHDTTGANASTVLPGPDSATYRRIKLDYRANATGALRIDLIYGGGAGKAEWDDVAVVEKNTLEYGFESGALAPWRVFGGAAVAVTAGAARSDSFGLELSGGSGSTSVFRDIAGLTAGQNYQVTAFVRRPAGSGTASLWLHDTTGANASPLQSAPNLSSFQPVVLTYTANATGAVRIHLVYGGGPGTVAWDDVTVAERVLHYGFESGALEPWRTWGGATAAVTAGAARTGSFGLELSGGSGSTDVFFDIGGLKLGPSYQVTVFVRRPAGSGTASLWLHDTTGTNKSPRQSVPASNSFQPVMLTYTANATGAMRIHLLYGGGPGTVAWDDVTVSGPSGPW